MRVWAFNPAALAGLVDRYGVEAVDRMLGELVEWAEDGTTRAFLQPVWPGFALKFTRRGHIITLAGVVVLRMIEVEE